MSLRIWPAARQCLRISSRSNSTQVRGAVDKAVAYYYDVIGITEVTKAKKDVIDWEQKLSDAQLERRQKQFELRKVQTRLKEIHNELDRTPRGQDRYLLLITEEHENIKVEQALMNDFEQLENNEREAFHQLSNKIGEFMTELKSVFNLESPKLADVKLQKPEGDLDRFLDTIKEQNQQLTKQMTELKRLLVLDQALTKDPNAVVYVGDEMELLLKKTEENIESKMKLQTLLIVVLAYGIVGVAAPLLYLWYTRDL